MFWTLMRERFDKIPQELSEEYERKVSRLLAHTTAKMELPSTQIRKTMSEAGLIRHIRSSVLDLLSL